MGDARGRSPFATGQLFERCARMCRKLHKFAVGRCSASCSFGAALVLALLAPASFAEKRAALCYFGAVLVLAALVPVSFAIGCAAFRWLAAAAVLAATRLLLNIPVRFNAPT